MYTYCFKHSDTVVTARQCALYTPKYAACCPAYCTRAVECRAGTPTGPAMLSAINGQSSESRCSAACQILQLLSFEPVMMESPS